MSGKRIFLYVQHLLGIGHLKRGATLSAALGDAGCEVTFVTGGYPVPEAMPARAHVVQLPPAGMAGLDFRALLDANGVPVSEPWRERRREQLLEAFIAARPHALIFELFPFGRRQMRFELLPLLDAARKALPRPLIVSSVRDVLGQRDPAKQDEMLALFERYFDYALVHGDPHFLAFGETFRHAAKLGERLRHTGFIVDRAEGPGRPGDMGAGDVLVSAGGGAVGAKLLETAIRARPLTSLSSRHWRLLSGVNLDAPAFAGLSRLAEQDATAGVTVERSRPDFRTLLQNCAVSVSQGGYNTVMEILDCGTRAVIVPFAGGKETEQTLRANLLAERGRIEIVAEDTLEPARLAAAIDRAASRAAPGPSPIDLDGARKSAELIMQWTADCAW